MDSEHGRTAVAQPGDDGLGLPFWLLRVGALGWRMLVIVALGLLLFEFALAIGTVTATVEVAVIASTAVMPVVRGLRARGWGAGKAAAVGTFLVFGTGTLVVAITAVVLIANAAAIVAATRAGFDELERAAAEGRVPADIADAIRGMIEGTHSWLGSNLGAIGGSVASLFTVLLLGAFTTFYVLADDERWFDWATQSFDERGRSALGRVTSSGAARLGDYMRRVAALAVINAAIALVALAVLGVPLPIALATLVFVGGFVPYLGAIASTIVLLLAALASAGGPVTLLLFALVVAGRASATWLVSRWAATERGHASPALVLLALPVGAYLGGFFGLVTVVPIAVALLAAGSRLAIELPDLAEEETVGPRLVPRWLDVLAAWSWRLLAGIALLAVLLLPVFVIPTVALPLIVAAVLAATLAPLVDGLVGRGWGRTTATALTMLVVSGVIIVVTGVSVAALVGNVADVASRLNLGAGDANDALGGLGGLLGGLTDEIGSNAEDIVLGAVGSLAAIAAVVTIGLILTFIALRDARGTWASLTAHLAPWRRRELDAAASRSVSVLSGYMLGTGALSLFNAGTQYVLMVVLGAPFALPIFALSFFAGYIPYIGGFITGGMAFLMVLTTHDLTAIVVFGTFTVIFNIVQGNFLAPLVFSRAINIHPAIILLATPAGAALGGILGMFLVVPILGLIATTWRTVLEVMGQPHEASTAAGADATAQAGSDPQAAPTTTG